MHKHAPVNLCPPPVPSNPPSLLPPAPRPPRLQEFYEFATKKLTPGGVLVTQSGAAAVHLKDECFTVIHKTLKSVFAHVTMSIADVPSFGCCWGFNLATDSEAFNAKVRRIGERGTLIACSKGVVRPFRHDARA